MSSGAFVKSKYAASYSSSESNPVHPIRVQPETLTAVCSSITNSAPSGGINNPISAQVSRSRRSKGLRPRTVTMQAPATGQPTNYKPGGYTTIPCLTEAFYEACTAGASVSYLGATFTVVSTSAEVAS